MAIKDIMTRSAEYIPTDTTLRQAAQKMRDLDCGFLPISDTNQSKLQGVITDRDICIRAVAEGMNVENTKVDQIKSEKVLYCFENDDIEAAATSMRDQHVYRLIVLDNDQDKNLVGIVSLGDLVRSGQIGLASEASEGIVSSKAA